MSAGVARVRLALPGRRAVPVLVADVEVAAPRWAASADVVVRSCARAATAGDADDLISAWPGAIAAAVHWSGGTVWSVRRLGGVTAEDACFLETALGACLVAVAAFEPGECGEDFGLEMR